MITPYFDSLFDDFGIWQHADGEKPLPEHGYALDDATRGLLICLALGRSQQSNTLFNYILQSRKGDEFYGFYNAERKPIQFPASEDAKGQVAWAMGYASSLNFKKIQAQHIIGSLRQSLLSLQSVRGLAYALLGAIYYDRTLALALQRSLAGRFHNLKDAWFWPENVMTYANGIIPYALLRYALVFGDKPSEQLGRKILTFIEKQCVHERLRGPIGYEGWYKQGDPKAADDGQQAIDVTYMIFAWMCAWQLSHNKNDLRYPTLWMLWFEGENIANRKMYEQKTLKAFDGIHLNNPNHHKQGVNYHSGAESNICFLLARYLITAQSTL
ncbi:MAG TPA: hypothetical protein VNX65_03250 [Patescibacteria group bacterium]|jgi:hypothetical protein|nr:hypothetical protein [Patescibacteria group bacterium]